MRRGLLGIWILATHMLSAQQVDVRHMDVSRADSVAWQYQGESLLNLLLLTTHLTEGLATDAEKFRAIYRWVCTNVENDHSFSVQVREKRKKLWGDSLALAQWNQSKQKQAFKTLFRDKRTICTGYAYLIREMATLANIECRIINGYGRNAIANVGEPAIPNHSWNAVRLNGKWYLCDATWSSGYYDLSQTKLVQEFNEGYFLTEPSLFLKSHYPLDTDWALLDVVSSLTDFIHAPLVYKGTYTHQLLPVAPLKMKCELRKFEELSLTFRVLDALPKESILLRFRSGVSDYQVRPEVNTQGDHLILTHILDRKGYFDVDVMVGEEVVATYVLEVRRPKK